MAFITGILGFGMVVQVIVFIVVSLVLLIATRPIAVKFFNQERQKTNAESLIGQQALVLEDIDTLQSKGCLLYTSRRPMAILAARTSTFRGRSLTRWKY